MGIFSKKQEKQIRSYLKVLYGNNIKAFVYDVTSSIYDIPEVRTAINKMAEIFSTIPIYYERKERDGTIKYLDNTSLQRVLTLKPNPLQNATQFWQNIIAKLLQFSNVFIEPVFDDNGQLLYLYPLEARSFELSVDLSGKAFVKFYDMQISSQTVSEKIYNLNSLIYINRFSQITGGKAAQINIYETVLKALESQIVNVASPNKPRALLTLGAGTGSAIKEKDRVGTMQEVQASFDSTVNGIAYLDKLYNVTPINWNENDVNRALMQFVINVVYNYFGINENIINNKATETEMNAFIQTSIKPIAMQVEQELTQKLFTQREIECGNRIELDTFALSISPLSARTSFMQMGLRAGVVNIDEARELVGYPPLKDGLGQMYRTTADTINLAKVDEFQAAQKGVNKGKEEDDGKESIVSKENNGNKGSGE